MNKTLPELCGIAAPGQKFMATKIVKYLQDGSVSNVVLPPASWGAVLLTCVNFLRNRWHGAPEDEGQMAYDTESLAEMLMSSGWRNRHASYSEFMFLGWDESELEKPAPDDWYDSGWWNVIALCGDWKIRTHTANKADLVRITYFDEGYSLHLWFAGHYK